MALYLVIEGEGPKRNEYEALAADFKIIDKCFFVGFRQMDEHIGLLSISDIVVVPSYYDPWGLVVHEGMLMAKPVIASDRVGAAIDRIEHEKNGFIFPAGDLYKLSWLIKFLASDKKYVKISVKWRKKQPKFGHLLVMLKLFGK